MISKIMVSSMMISFMGLVSCQTEQFKHRTPASGMFKVAILYPNGDDKVFDRAYYKTKHMPMVAGFLGKNLFFYEIDKGISGRTPNDKVPFLAIGYFYIKDVAEYNAAIGQNIDTILSDIKKYTNILPVIQISEIDHLGHNVLK